MVFLLDPKCQGLKYQDTRTLLGRSRSNNVSEGGPWPPRTRNTQAECSLIIKIPGLHTGLLELDSLEVRPRSLHAKHTLEVVSDNH